jgi:hypothetical protein
LAALVRLLVYIAATSTVPYSVKLVCAAAPQDAPAHRTIVPAIKEWFLNVMSAPFQVGIFSSELQVLLGLWSEATGSMPAAALADNTSATNVATTYQSISSHSHAIRQPHSHWF